MVAFSCAIDALRAANQIIGEPVYAWQALSPTDANAVSSSNIEIPATRISEAKEPDVVVVCGGDRSHSYENEKLTNWLHVLANNGRAIGSISDGAFVVAAAGLFDQVPSTIHWKCLDAYRERFPKLEIRPSIFEISDRRFSSAGGTSSLDLMLHFIRQEHGNELAGQVADNYFHDTIRDGSREQHVTNAFRIAGRIPLLADALLMMEDNLEAPLTIEYIADSLQISRRQLDRIFAQHMKKTPQEFYRELRLARAAGLLTQTGMSVTEIALGCGFHSASHLGKYFSRNYNATPGEYRRQNLII